VSDLEAMLRSTEDLGEISLFKLSGGWRASIDLPAPAGCQAKVSSDFDCGTPTEAVEQMLGRLGSLRRTVGSAAPRIAA
jgi:hypothetical protein